MNITEGKLIDQILALLKKASERQLLAIYRFIQSFLD